MLDQLTRDPIAALVESEGVLGVITGMEGAAYRPVGAAMAFLSHGGRIGTVSSGCVENALALEAEHVLQQQQARRVRYGKGSPWFDIQLPCGAGLDIHLWPGGRHVALRETAQALQDRQAHALILPPDGLTGARLTELQPAGWSDDAFALPRIPPLRILALGSGIETVIFAHIARSAGRRVQVASDDEQVLAAISHDRMSIAQGLHAARNADPQTAIVLFFHEHTKEADILAASLEGAAFWIGAQGSRRAQANRLIGLRELGVSDAALARVRDRIGLIPSTRDPETLAIAVLADMYGAYKQRWADPYFNASEAAASV